jgi:hypothetical protein
MQARELQIHVLDGSGASLAEETVSLPENSCYVFDVRKGLAGKARLEEDPKLFNVVARGGAASFAVVTFVINEKTGNMAVEHSLSPHYYVSTGLARVRAEALTNFG